MAMVKMRLRLRLRLQMKQATRRPRTKIGRKLVVLLELDVEIDPCLQEEGSLPLYQQFAGDTV